MFVAFCLHLRKIINWEMDKSVIKKYIDDFKRLFSPFMKPGVTFNSTICPYKGGVVCIFQFNTNQNDSVVIKDSNKTALDVFESEDIKGIVSVGPGVDKANIRFPGTNIANMGNRLVIIKDDNPDEWGITATVNDVSRIIGKAGYNGK